MLGVGVHDSGTKGTGALIAGPATLSGLAFAYVLSDELWLTHDGADYEIENPFVGYDLVSMFVAYPVTNPYGEYPLANPYDAYLLSTLTADYAISHTLTPFGMTVG